MEAASPAMAESKDMARRGLVSARLSTSTSDTGWRSGPQTETITAKKNINMMPGRALTRCSITRGKVNK